MNKIVKVYMNESKDIVISVTGKENFIIHKDSMKLYAKQIFDFLDYSVGDTYEYDKISEEGKVALVLKKMKDLLKDITDQITEIKLEENDAAMKSSFDEINNVNN